MKSKKTRVLHDENGTAYKFNQLFFIRMIDEKKDELQISRTKYENIIADELNVAFATVHSWSMLSNGISDIALIYKLEEFWGLEKGELLIAINKPQSSIQDKLDAEFYVEQVENFEDGIRLIYKKGNEKKVVRFKLNGLSLEKENNENSILLKKTDFKNIEIGFGSIRCSHFLKMYFLEFMIRSKNLDNVDFSLYDVIKVDGSILDADDDFIRARDLLSNMIGCYYSYEDGENMFGDNELEGSTAIFLSSVYINSTNSIYLKYNKDIFDYNIKKKLMETLHRMQKETTEAFNYLEKHPNGIPYMCGYKDGVSDLESWVEGDYLSGPKVYEAWNEEDAKMQFLIEQRKYNLYYFYESEFLTEFAEYLYYDELKGIIEENMVDKENLLKYVDNLNAKYFPDSDSVKISEEEFVDIFINEIDKKNLFNIMGNINFEIFWRRCMQYKIYAIADVKAKEYLNYCV